MLGAVCPSASGNVSMPTMAGLEAWDATPNSAASQGAKTAGSLDSQPSLPPAASDAAFSTCSYEADEANRPVSLRTSSTGSLNLLRPIASLPVIAVEDPEYQAWRVSWRAAGLAGGEFECCHPHPRRALADAPLGAWGAHTPPLPNSVVGNPSLHTAAV